MTKVLLDYPWPVEACLDPDPAPSETIRRFLFLLQKTGLGPVRFLDPEEIAQMSYHLGERHGRGRFALLNQFLHHCQTETDDECLATPRGGPGGLKESWRRALARELRDPDAWRNPQIVVPESRRAAWPPADEVAIDCDACDGHPASGPHNRVVAVLERYDQHPCASADLDPWDLRLDDLPTPGARLHDPCCLPKLPMLERVPVENLDTVLSEARRLGWKHAGRYFFVPPADCQLREVTMHVWRVRRAFRRSRTIDGHTGPVDFEGRIWEWHHEDRHWDVQLDPDQRLEPTAMRHLRVSYTGQQR